MQYLKTCKQELYSSFICTLFHVFYLFFDTFLVIFSYPKPL